MLPTSGENKLLMSAVHYTFLIFLKLVIRYDEHSFSRYSRAFSGTSLLEIKTLASFIPEDSTNNRRSIVKHSQAIRSMRYVCSCISDSDIRPRSSILRIH